MFKLFLLSLISILVIMIIWYTYQNRAEDRVVYTFITVMFIATLGFITKESLSNKKISDLKNMPIAVFYYHPNYREANLKLPYNFNIGYYAARILDEDKPKNLDITFGQEIFRDILELSIIDSLLPHNRFFHWDVGLSYDGYIVDESKKIKNEEGTKVTSKELAIHLKDNYFVKNNIIKDAKSSFPLNSEIKITKDSHFTIFNIKTKYNQIRLILMNSQASITSGYLQRFKVTDVNGVSKSFYESSNSGHVLYQLEIKYEQNILYNGSPEMEKYREWAYTIIDHFIDTYDFNLIKENLDKDYIVGGINGIQNNN